MYVSSVYTVPLELALWMNSATRPICHAGPAGPGAGSSRPNNSLAYCTAVSGYGTEIYHTFPTGGPAQGAYAMFYNRLLVNSADRSPGHRSVVRWLGVLISICDPLNKSSRRLK